MKKFLLSVLICLPLLAKAQTDEKYLAGAIPVVDGKVSFTTEMQVPALSQEQLYDALLDWANTYFKPEGKLNARVLYTNKEEGTMKPVTAVKNMLPKNGLLTIWHLTSQKPNWHPSVVNLEEKQLT